MIFHFRANQSCDWGVYKSLSIPTIMGLHTFTSSGKGMKSS
jgi:hypothetical protein